MQQEIDMNYINYLIEIVNKQTGSGSSLLSEDELDLQDIIGPWQVYYGDVCNKKSSSNG